jgi:hypothetical protein
MTSEEYSDIRCSIPCDTDVTSRQSRGKAREERSGGERSGMVLWCQVLLRLKTCV